MPRRRLKMGSSAAKYRCAPLSASRPRSRRAARLGDKRIEELVVRLAVRVERVDQLAFARLGDVRRRRLERVVESPPLLRELRPRVAPPEQHEQEDRGRVLPLQALLHVLRRDDRVVVLGEMISRATPPISRSRHALHAPSPTSAATKITYPVSKLGAEAS